MNRKLDKSEFKGMNEWEIQLLSINNQTQMDNHSFNLDWNWKRWMNEKLIVKR